MHKLALYIIAISSLATATISLLYTTNSIQVQAAGVAVTTTPSTRSVSTSGNITLQYTGTVSVPTTGSILVSFDNSYGGSAAATFTINGVAPSSSSSTTSGTTRTYTLRPGATVATGSVSIVVAGLTTPASQGNYPFTVTTSTGDYGGSFQYVGQANVVEVRAIVPPTLSFSIRNSDDTANINSCDMGNLSVISVGTCSYRLKVGGNPMNGFSILVSTSGNFTSGSDNLANASAGSGGSGGTNIVAGTESYGVVITPGSITNGTASIASQFNAGTTNSVSFATTTSSPMIVYSGPNNPSSSNDTTNTSLVRHNAAISSNTSAGLYTQTVTYTVVPSF